MRFRRKPVVPKAPKANRLIVELGSGTGLAINLSSTSISLFLKTSIEPGFSNPNFSSAANLPFLEKIVTGGSFGSPAGKTILIISGK